MKRLILICVSVLFASAWLHAERNDASASRQVIGRFAGGFPERLTLRLVPDMAENGCDAYRYYARKGRLTVEASSCVALCRGFYAYVLANGYGVMTWSGSRCELPERFPDCAVTEAVSPFRHHLFWNVCTNGYSTAYWTWDEWSREIDWLALHGFDMPLAPVAGEAILARVWRDMGLSDDEINEYFTGPGHMPWMRMGNMTGLDGAPTHEWHEAQVALQHRIIDRMRSLGMKPVFQGFAGFVPKAMKRHYPDISLTTTEWGGFESYMLSPLDSLFTGIQRRFVTEWEKEFGKGKYYLVDSFNEMDIPFGEQGSPERAELLRNYSSTIYSSLTSANPDAVWVMQGWMFGYQRNIWDPQSAEALLSGVPDGRMIVIDLAVDFNRFIWKNRKSWEYLPGMCGKEWIYSTTPNFGGRTALAGNLESYMNGHIEALESADRGRMTGYGASPEGIEQNEPVYEVIADAGWRGERADLSDFLKRYSAARYGSCPDGVVEFWKGMLAGPYSRCTNNARYLWQLRPVGARVPTMGIDRHYFKAIESFLSCADRLGDSELYRHDAVAYSAMYLAAKADEVLRNIEWGYVYGKWRDRPEMLAAQESEFFCLLEDCDRLLESHPVFRLERWAEMAARAGRTDEERDAFEEEQRRLVTVWGGPNLSDYSCRLWSGLVRDYYIPRWRHYFDNRRALEDGSLEFYDFRTNEEVFHTLRGVSEVCPFDEPLAAACRLVGRASSVSSTESFIPDDAFGYICRYDFTAPMVSKTVSVLDSDFRKASSIVLEHVSGKDAVYVGQVSFRSHNDSLGTVEVNRTVAPGGTIEVPLDSVARLPELAMEINIQFVVKGETAADASLVMKFTEK